MPITIDTVAGDLYLLHWIGDVKLEEIYASHDDTARMAAAAGIDKYVHVLDLTQVKSFPFDPLAFYRVLTAHAQNFAVLVVGGPFLARTAIRVLDSMIKNLTARTYKELPTALKAAEALLAQQRGEKQPV